MPFDDEKANTPLVELSHGQIEEIALMVEMAFRERKQAMGKSVKWGDYFAGAMATFAAMGLWGRMPGVWKAAILSMRSPIELRDRKSESKD